MLEGLGDNGTQGDCKTINLYGSAKTNRSKVLDAGRWKDQSPARIKKIRKGLDFSRQRGGRGFLDNLLDAEKPVQYTTLVALGNPEGLGVPQAAIPEPAIDVQGVHVVADDFFQFAHGLVSTTLGLARFRPKLHGFAAQEPYFSTTSAPCGHKSLLS